MTVQNARILHGKRNFDVSTDLPMFDGTAVLTSSYSCTGTRTAVLHVVPCRVHSTSTIWHREDIERTHSIKRVVACYSD